MSHRWNLTRVTLVVLFMVCLFAAQSAIGQTTFLWNNDRNFWDANFGWTPEGPPTGIDIASFENDVEDEVSWDNTTGNRQIDRVNIAAGNYTFLNTVNTTQHELTINSSANNSLSVLGSSSIATVKGLHFNTPNGGVLLSDGATLHLDGSHPLSSKLTVGRDLFGDGNLKITSGASARITQKMIVGHAVTGTFTIESGGTLTSNGGTIANLPGTTGTATVTGAGSSWSVGENLDLVVGNLGSGTVNIEAGAQVTSGRGLIGREEGSSGTVNVSGVGSKWTDSETTVGAEGNGTLNILDGGEVISFGALIGREGGVGKVKVAGSGSKWSTSAFFSVGQFSEGTLDVEAGGSVRSDAVVEIGGFGAKGTATVTGATSELKTSDNVFIGASVFGSGTLNIAAGGVVASKTAFVGQGFEFLEKDAEFTGRGTVNVTGAGSTWTVSESLTVAPFATGSVNIQSGGAVEVTTDSFVGQFSTGDGIATVTGPNSKWSSLGSLQVGGAGKGKLDILAGGTAFNTDGVIGNAVTGNGNVTVSGEGSRWTTENNLTIGSAGTGTLQVEATGAVTSKNAFIGSQANSIGTVNVSGRESRWTNSEQLLIGQFGSGTLNISAAGQVANAKSVIGLELGSTGKATVSGPGSKWTNSSSLTVGDLGSATLEIENAGEVTSVFGSIGLFNRSTGTVTVTGEGSQWKDSENVQVGFEGNGTLNVVAKGRVENRGGIVGANFGGVGTVKVFGENSTWANSAFLNVGRSGIGALQVEAGGAVTSREADIGLEKGSVGEVTVKGAGSTWTNSDFLIVARSGSGRLNVEAGGVVSNRNGFVGLDPNSQGIVTVTGSGSQWKNTGDLAIGPFGQGTLQINNGGLVTVAGTTTVNSTSSVNLAGGRLEFGTMDQTAMQRVTGQSGSMAGTLNVSGAQSAASFPALTNGSVDASEVRLVNSGTLSGQASLGSSLTNQATGEIEVLAGERMRFRSSVASTNLGEINNFGGRVDFQARLTNEASGFIAGRGVFAANGGWTNRGVMAFSGGFADVLGDVDNSERGKIVIAGGGTTTFFDDVQMTAGNLNVDVSQESDVVFFGSYNGGSTGPGTVHAFGDLRPGNSPASVQFGGDLKLGASTLTQIELGGLNAGQFDQLLVAGDLFLGGQLVVQLIDGFTLSPNQVFEVGSTNGSLVGTFSNFNDGDLVGNFGGIDLFIDYQSGAASGNGFSLITVVPEPSSALGLALGVAALGWRRRRA